MKQKLAQSLFLSGAVLLGMLTACAPNSGAPVYQADQPTQTAAATIEPTATLPVIRITTKIPKAVAIPTEPAQETPGMNEAPIPTPFDAALSKVVDQARTDLAGKLNVSADAIELVSASSVTWPDGSLGCPRPGMMYTQVMTDGMLIKFRAEGKEYEYHSGGARLPFLCTK